MADTSYLDLTIDNDSNFLRTHMPYVVRDAKLAVVSEGTTGGAPVELPPGLYSVEMVTPDGAAVQAVVHLEPGKTANVPTPEGLLAESVTPRAPERNLPGLQPMGGPEPRGQQAELLGHKHCTSEQPADQVWHFLPEPGLGEIPTALFRIGDRHIEMSLPLNPLGGSPELSGCNVSTVWETDRPSLRMEFAVARKLCNAMAGLLRHNTASVAADLFDSATDLLHGKYSDPPGAALGGLTLHRLGRLPEQRGWIENLATDFRWLPDGGILHAALLMKETEPADRQRGLDSLLSATAKRPMYTDGLSLALELLRRWPDDDRLEERTERLGGLAPHSAYAEWNSISLSVEIPG